MSYACFSWRMKEYEHVINTNMNVELCLKPVLNLANVCSQTWWEVFGEPSWFLIGQTFLREPRWEYSLNCDEAIFRVQKASLNMFWNIRPIRRTLPQIGWEQSSPVDEEEIIKMDDGVARFFTRFGGNLLTCGRCSAALSRGPRMR